MRGSCLCGAVVFDVTGALRDVIACHCAQCRKVSGHFWAASSVPMERFRLVRDDGLRWFRSSDQAERGFCGGCGASLFWRPTGEDRISFAAGALDGETGLKIADHIFADSHGDYYAVEGPPPAPPPSTPGLLSAGCLCGAVRFTLPGPLGPVTACHCTQCRKLSGHYAASADVEGVVAPTDAPVAVYRTPNGGTRGFCATCGSGLWFRDSKDALSVEAGVVEGATGGHLASHIFVADKGDYYALTDDLPQFHGSGPDTP